jgi:hypothetical protein
MKLGSQRVLGACHRVGTPTDLISKGHDRWDKYPLLLKLASPRTNIASSECRRYVSSRRFARNQTDFWGRMVGTGRFELPTPRTPSECSTRLSHVPTRKEPAASHPQRMGLTRGFYHLRHSLVRSDQSFPIVVGLSCFSAPLLILPFRQL